MMPMMETAVHRAEVLGGDRSVKSTCVALVGVPPWCSGRGQAAITGAPNPKQGNRTVSRLRS